MDSNSSTLSIINLGKSLPSTSDYKRIKSIIAKRTWSELEKEIILKGLSQLLLKQPNSLKFASQCTNALLLHLLLSSAKLLSDNQIAQTSSNPVDTESVLEIHENFLSTLSQLNGRFPDIERLCCWYVANHSLLLSKLQPIQSPEPVKKKPKKPKKSTRSSSSTASFLKLLYHFLCYNSMKIDVHWDWTVLVNFLEDSQPDVRWLAYHCLAKLVSMPTSFLDKVTNFKKNEMVDLIYKYNDLFKAINLAELDQPFLNALSTSSEVPLTSDLDIAPTYDSLDSQFGLLSVCGINIVTNTNIDLDSVKKSRLCSRFVLVPSTKLCLRDLTLALKSNQPVLLEGTVGCGKTSIIRYLSELMGRNEPSAPESVSSVQLGDQTDAKLLVGVYCCTEIPGEFVWKPGPLTKAMMNGGWLLLEDIDYAPLDVVTLLAGVVECNSLMVPGMTKPLKASPGFQIFSTRRVTSFLGTTHSISRPLNRSTQELLKKNWTRILMPSMTEPELKLAISTRWPNLKVICDRIVQVFNVVSNIPYSQGSRNLSSRDLFKWCSRISVNFELVAEEGGLPVFLHAMDCFCFCIQDQDTKLRVAGEIGSELNIPKEKTDYYCLRSKPEIKQLGNIVHIGRVSCPVMKDSSVSFARSLSRIVFSRTRQASSVLETVASAVWFNEPVLLVGETGTGKTSIVQYLTFATGQKLTVINMNQQSDSTDLLGGYKPVEFKVSISPMRLEFEELFFQTFSTKKNTNFLNHIMNCFALGRWSDLLSLMGHVQKEALKVLKSDSYLEVPTSKLTREELFSRWSCFGDKIYRLSLQLKQSDRMLVFSFIPGALIKAMKEGSWILLDEINLAEAETLECLGNILEGSTLNFLENGEDAIIEKHPNFRLFACMNPATDVGKKDLPAGIRNRFTEIYMEELCSKEELLILCQGYLQSLNLPKILLDGIVSLYLELKQQAKMTLCDGTGHSPHYSLRTLCRALSYASANTCKNVQRSLYEAFCLSFLSQLDRSSHPRVQKMISNHILGKAEKSVLKQKLPLPASHSSKKSPPATYLLVEGYWIRKGMNESHFPANYVLTPTILRNLADIARIVSAMRFPVLLQGETSVGKTSLIEWLAQASGNICVRVNNHEHTDLQEYVGNYVADESGKLVFKEGVLVEAMRYGHWIILDELNLAPTEVLEALNRVLDDNRELFIVETQTLVKAHPQFLLFATQNPPGLYGGRKVLSRAFRNRFIELHFDEIPSKEIEVILGKRCCLPPTYCRKLVAVMLELQIRRRESGVFAGKQGFITLRDLFRWGERYRKANIPQDQKFYDWDQHLADEGYLLLAGRVRRPEEENVIIEVLQKHLKRTVNPEALFNPIGIQPSPTTEEVLFATVLSPTGDSLERTIQGQMQRIVWTKNMSRLAVLVGQALKFNEPILLVGDTGCGKTTICQILSMLLEKDLLTVNCHMHSESADFLGSLRPVRNKDSNKLFEWADGPLVKAMCEGQMFLADEISLADDSVLERLNSVLEPEGTLLLAEKGNSNDDRPMYIKASNGFRFLATMNPGGDYGKKELSPALRNRFTEIWCPSVSSKLDLQSVVDKNITKEIDKDSNPNFGKEMTDFVDWFSRFSLSQKCTITLRDFLSWTQFMNCCVESGALKPREAYVHGGQMTFIDSIGSGLTSCGSENEIAQLKSKSLELLHHQMGLKYKEKVEVLKIVVDDDKFGIHPFLINKGSSRKPFNSYCLEAPTPNLNAFRLLRAMQLFKPILLEGSPGVGKTTLVSSIAKMAGHEVVRINLSEQTDISELFGADLPTEGGRAGEFEWRDGPLLEALKNGHWLLLDELNLASQSVLEGLNACLDHRGEIYIPEIDRTFKVSTGKTRIFACQNPQFQGGARKGLPRSFLNRFIQVFVEPLNAADLKIILMSFFPNLNAGLIDNMVTFSLELEAATSISNKDQFGSQGSPWEFNLRDLMRWSQLIEASNNSSRPGDFVQLIYSDRMRTKDDKLKVLELFFSIFKSCASTPSPVLSLKKNYLQIGQAFLKRQVNPAEVDDENLFESGKLLILHHQLKSLQSLAKCMEMNWMAVLVGSSGTGKTSMVKLLSSLTNNHLSILNVNSEMDTTELLGGFEQADLLRRLGNLWRSTERLVRAKCWELMLTFGPRDEEEEDIAEEHHAAINVNLRHQALRALLVKWLECRKIENVTRCFFSKPTANGRNENLDVSFVSFTRIMRSLLAILTQTGFESVTVKVIECELIEVEMEFQRKHHRTCDGGRFEWVDSLLVTAIKEGHWLLIENVNLCSSSVLDRLNPLLEPNGVLSITEQGVINGSIPLVVPHPDFRLILSMDSTNGEISRAMRNRGVEIYLLNEEGCGLDNWDTMVMLRSLGFDHQYLAVRGLLKVHEIVSSESTLLEKPSIVQLIQAAKLTITQAQQGLPFYYALLESARNIYLNQLALNIDAKKDLQEKIEESLKCIFLNTEVCQGDSKTKTSEIKNEDEKPVLEAPLSQSLPYFSACDYKLCSSLTNIRREGQLLSYLMLLFVNNFADSVHNASSKRTNKSEIIIPHISHTEDPWTIPSLLSASYEDWLSALRQVTMIMLESASFRDLPLRLKWVQSVLSAFNDNSLGTLVSKLDTSQVFMELFEVSKTISLSWAGTVFKDRESLPINLNSFPSLSRLLASKLSARDVERMESLNNKLRLTMTVSQFKWSQPSHCSTACQSRRPGAASSVCLFHMMHFSTSSVSLRSTTRSTAQPTCSLIKFFEELEKILLEVVEDLSQTCPSTIANSFLESVWFLNQLWNLCDQRDQNSEFLINSLKLLWNWSNKHALPIVLEFCKKTGVKTKELDIASKRITKDLFPLVPEFHKLRSKIVSFLPAPDPFPTEKVANAFLMLKSLEDHLSLSSLLSSKNQNDWLNFISNRPEMARKMLNGLEIIFSNPDKVMMDFEIIREAILQEIRKEAIASVAKPEEYDEKEKVLSSDEYLMLNPKLQVNVEIMPFQAFMFQHLISKLVSTVLENQLLMFPKKKLPTDVDIIRVDNILTHQDSLTFLPSQIYLISHMGKLSTTKQIKKVTTQLLLQCMEKTLRSARNFNFKHILTLVQNPVSLQPPSGDGSQPMPLSLMCCLLNNGTDNLSLDNEHAETMQIPKTVVSESESAQCSLPLGVFKEKLAQLEWLKTTLWRNAAVLDNNTYLIDEVKNVTLWFQLLVQSLEDVTKNAPLRQEPGHCDPQLDWNELTLQNMIDLSLNAGLPGGEYGEFLHTAKSAINFLFSFKMAHFKSNTKEIQNTLGVAWVNVGFLTATFFAPWDSIDPVQKQIHKLGFHKKYLSELQRSLDLRDWLSKANVGMPLHDCEVSDLPKWVQDEMQRKEHFAHKVASLEGKVAFRSDPSQFSALATDVKQFFTYLATVSRVNDASFNLNQIRSGNGTARASQILNEIDVWLQSLTSFYNKITNKYFLYQDLVTTFATGIAQMIHGFKILQRQAFSSFANVLLQLKSCETLTNLLSRLGLFPYINEANPDPLSMAGDLINPNFVHDVSQVLKHFEKTKDSSQCQTSLDSWEIGLQTKDLLNIAKSALMELLNQASMISSFGSRISSSCILDETFERVNFIFVSYINLWQKECDIEKQKKEDRESMYEIRTLDYETEMSDADRETLEIQQNFPSYSEEFFDIVPSLNDEDDSVKRPPSKKSEVHLDSKRLLFLWNVHEQFLKCFESSNQTQQFFKPNFTQPFLLRYKLLSKLISNGGHIVDDEPTMLNSHILASQSATIMQDSTVIGSTKWNIYHSPLPSEAIKCHKHIDELRCQIHQLLEQFPQHPALQRILRVVKRIYGFPMSTPLMKLITGLEVVLTVSQDWETMAHRGISLQSHLSAITDLIIQWRKMELKGFSRALDLVYEDQHLKSSPLWAHLYSLILSSEEDWDKIVALIVQFIEDSTLGQFHCRLQLLSLFSKHCLMLSEFSPELRKKKAAPDKSKRYETLHWIFHNVQNFYGQFLPKVQSLISSLRKPIEDKLKEYLKIAQWNDVNFYRVKTAVEKSHRTIHKHSKEFENCLLQPVRQLLLPSLAGTDKKHELDGSKWSFSFETKTYLVILTTWQKESFEVDISPKAISVRIDSPLHRLPQLSKKIKKISKQLLQESKVSSRVHAVDNLCGSVVEYFQDLQSKNAIVEQEPDKDKRKKDAKFHYAQKKKALADLFKQLSEMGLSFKKGLSISKDWKASDELKNPIIPIYENFQPDKPLENCLIKANEGKDKYLYKSIARLTFLINKLQAPAKDVDLGVIHRCSGFVNHLMFLVSHKQQELSTVSQTYCRLKNGIKNLKRLSEEHSLHSKIRKDASWQDLLPPQVCTSNWQNELESLVIRTESTLHQFKCLLDCCPNESSSDFKPVNLLDETVKSLQNATLHDTVLGDQKWFFIDSKVTECLAVVNEVKKILVNHPSDKGVNLFTWQDVENLRKSFEVFERIKQLLSSICDASGSVGPVNECCSVCVNKIEVMAAKFEKELEKDINIKNREVRTNLRDHSHQLSTNVELLLDGLTRTILLATQSVIKESSLIETSDESDTHLEDAEDDMDSAVIEKKHLTEKLFSFHTKVFEVLRLSEIEKLVTSLILYIATIWESNDNPRVVSHLVYFSLKSLPLIQQYSNLVLFYLTSAVAAHRASLKLLSVLTGIFSELAQKGFCLPNDLQDEILNDKEPGTKFNEIEDGGLGDGKGSKDVSDRIESEDQLEDTLKQGETKEKKEEEEEEEQKDDSKGIEMSEDFEGKAKDPEREESDDERSNSEDNDEEELDKQMGEVENEESEKLDEKLWGSESEGEDEAGSDDDFGGGMEQSESEIVAKSNKEKSAEEKKKEKKSTEKEETEDGEVNEMSQEDEYDGDHADPYQRSKDQETEEDGEDYELPEKLQLDMDTEDEQNESKEMEEGEAEEKDNDDELDDKDITETLDEQNLTDNDEGDKNDETSDKKENEEKIENLDDNGELETKPLSEAIPSTEPSSDDALMNAEQGKRETASENNENNEVGDDNQEQHGFSSEAQNENQGQAGTGSEMSTQEGKEALSDANLQQERQGSSSIKSTESERSLANQHSEQPQNKMETISSDDKEKNSNFEEKKSKASLYQHTLENQKYDAEALDIATEEEAAKSQPLNKGKEETDLCEEMPDDIEEKMEVDIEDQRTMQSLGKSLDKSKERSSKRDPKEIDDSIDEASKAIETVGERFPTLGAERGPESTIHTRHDLWSASSLIPKIELELPLLTGSETVVTSEEALNCWRSCDMTVAPLVQELCEQLRLVLEPTKSAKMKGDYRTGKRLNMRKIIPYIASQFRKDKIWLRRTKPSKRQYQIAIAVDDSSSMADNQSRQMAFESIALLGKALSLLEAGDITILKFGHDVNVVHNLGESFTDHSGVKVMQSFNFQQTKTRIAELVQQVTKLLVGAQLREGTSSRSELTQLLLVVSDGRGLFNEGEEVVNQAIRNAKANNIFMVFIILDNPKNKDSILDIKMPVFSEGTVTFQSYMEKFPFPFYVILREIRAMPIVLGEALRQWFELVTSAERR